MLNPLTLFVDTVCKGGATVSLLGVTPTSGYAVSCHPDRGLCLPLSSFDAQTLINWISDHAELLGREDLYVGTWVDCGWVYVDITTVLEDQEEALAAGRRHDQLAIFDLAAGVSIDC